MNVHHADHSNKAAVKKRCLVNTIHLLFYCIGFIYFSFTAPYAFSDPVLVSLNKPTTISSSDSTGPASNAVDGNNLTRWSSAYVQPSWIMIDLEDRYNITRVELLWSLNAHGVVYDIQVSDNTVDWQTVYSVSDGDGDSDILEMNNATGRYIRLWGIEKVAQWGFSLYEFSVFGESPVIPSPSPQYQHIHNRLENKHLRKNHLSSVARTATLSETSWGFDWVVEDSPEEGYVFLKNRLNGGDKYLRQDFNSKNLRVIPLQTNSWGYYWVIEESENYMHIKNRLSGQYLRAAFKKPDVYAANLSDSWGFDWQIENLPTPSPTPTPTPSPTATASPSPTPSPSVDIPPRAYNASCHARTRTENQGGGDGTHRLVRAFPNLPSSEGIVGLYQAPNDNSHWYYITLGGRIRSFANTSSANTVSNFLDLTSLTQWSGEAGLTGMAFHPNYPVDNRIFVLYNARGNLRSTLASYRVNLSSNQAIANSANILLTLPQPASNHNGGDIKFGPDGHLYASFGDGGGVYDQFNNGQNLSSLHSTIIRIDVSGESYSIPSSNPFANGGGRAEIFAYGLRNPWRMSFDRETGQLWAGDVGESSREEINRISLGANYGWPIREGTICQRGCGSGTTLPITEYRHGPGYSITGGYVYRGSQLGHLYGQYIFGDYQTGNIWSIPSNASPTVSPTPLFTQTGLNISTFAESLDGELYLVNLYGGRGNNFYRIEGSGSNNTTIVPDIPNRLSESGCFDVTSKTPTQGVVDYHVNSPLWSDGADKDRFFAIPNGENIDLSADGDFLFPVGSVLIKNFLHNDNLLETRLMMRYSDHWEHLSYIWREDQSEADLVTEGRILERHGIEHIVPSQTQCSVCHTNGANISLGIETLQLNHDKTFENGAVANHLHALSEQGYLNQDIGEFSGMRLYALDDNSATLEQKAKSYLHSNCSGCHRPNGTSPIMDLRFQTPLNGMNICNVTPSGSNFGLADARRINPGNAEASVIALRMSTPDERRMPPLASNVIDAEAVNVFNDWINGLTECN